MYSKQLNLKKLSSRFFAIVEVVVSTIFHRISCFLLLGTLRLERLAPVAIPVPQRISNNKKNIHHVL